MVDSYCSNSSSRRFLCYATVDAWWVNEILIIVLGKALFPTHPPHHILSLFCTLSFSISAFMLSHLVKFNGYCLTFHGPRVHKSLFNVM